MTELLGIESLVSKKTGADFRDNLIKSYSFWFLLLNDDQRLIGRCYAWSRIPGDLQDLALLPIEAVQELQLVMRNWSLALRLLEIGFIHPNYEWLGNEFQVHDGHGHLHMVPRYARPFTFLGEYCEDLNFSSEGGTRHDKPVGGATLQKRELSPDKKRRLIGRMLERFPED